MARYLTARRRGPRRTTRRRNFRRGLKQPGTPKAPLKRLPRPLKGRPLKRRRVMRRRMDVSGGDYTGKFPKLLRARRTRSSNGVSYSYDASSTVAESDCAHVGFSSVDPHSVIEMAFKAVVRYYCERYLNAPIDSDKTEVVSGQSYPVAGQADRGRNFGILWFYKNRSNTTGGQDIEEITTNSTLGAGVALTFGNLSNTMYANWLLHIGADADRVLIGFEVYAEAAFNDATGNTGIDNMNRMVIDKVKIKLSSKTRYRIQNQTVGDAGGTTQDDIRNNPVVGKIYKMKTPTPLLTDVEAAGNPATFWEANYTRSSPNGTVVVPRGMVMPFIGSSTNAFATNVITKQDYFKRPPLPSAFYTCTGVTQFGLQPGEMKQGQISFNYYGDFDTLIKNMHAQLFGRQTRDSFGTCHFFSFSKRMPTGTSSSITYSYDRFNTMFAVCKLSKTTYKPNNQLVSAMGV